MRYLLLHQIQKTPGKYAVTPKRMQQILGRGCSSLQSTFDDGYQAIYECLIETKRYPSNCIIFIVAGKVGGTNDWDQTGELAGQKLMDWPQIKELHQDGVKIGSHGYYHNDLRRLNPAKLDREVKGSKELLEDKLGRAIDCFAYPFGIFNPMVIDAVASAGYHRAMTTSDSVLQGMGDPFRTRRITVTGTEPDWLVRAKLSGLYDSKALWELPILAAEKVAITMANKSRNTQ